MGHAAEVLSDYQRSLKAVSSTPWYVPAIQNAQTMRATAQFAPQYQIQALKKNVSSKKTEITLTPEQSEHWMRELRVGLAPTCPACHFRMHQKIEPHSKEQFWLCQQYPKCMMVLPDIDPDEANIAEMVHQGALRSVAQVLQNQEDAVETPVNSPDEAEFASPQSHFSPTAMDVTSTGSSASTNPSQPTSQGWYNLESQAEAVEIQKSSKRKQEEPTTVSQAQFIATAGQISGTLEPKLSWL